MSVVNATEGLFKTILVNVSTTKPLSNFGSLKYVVNNSCIKSCTKQIKKTIKIILVKIINFFIIISI